MTSRPITIDEPHDTCFRCGKPTPLGVPLCDADNPAKIKGPSTTQVHGTIAVGLIGGFVLLFVLLGRLVTPGAGSLSPVVAGSAVQPDGSTQIVIMVTNTGNVAASASCRVSRGGVVGGGDIVFFTQQIPAGETREFTRTLPAGLPAGGAGSGGQPGSFSVLCN